MGEVKRGPRGGRYVRLGVKQRAVVARALGSSLDLVYPAGREVEACYSLHTRGILVHAIGYPGAWRLANRARDEHALRQSINLHREGAR